MHCIFWVLLGVALALASPMPPPPPLAPATTRIASEGASATQPTATTTTPQFTTQQYVYADWKDYVAEQKRLQDEEQKKLYRQEMKQRWPEIKEPKIPDLMARIVEDPIWDVGDHYLGVTLDFHAPRENRLAWGNSSVLSLDLDNPLFINLAKNLAPALLRLGGGPQDKATYKLNGFQCNTWFCLTMDRWADINNFANKTGLRIVMGLNALYGRRWKDPLSDWDPSNTYAFLKHTASRGYNVYAFGYGNELGTKLDWELYSKGLATVRGMINKFWPNPAKRPRLVSPDINQADGAPGASILRMARQHMDAFSYHLYTGFGGDTELDQQMLKPDFYEVTDVEMESLLVSVEPELMGVEKWVGESAAAWFSGRDMVTNTFLSSFWYVRTLGQLAQKKHSAFCRQALVGGWYGLLNWTNFEPHPDYWALSLWKQVMGRKVYDVQSYGARRSVWLFAHSSAQDESNPATRRSGSISVAIVNINPIAQRVLVTGYHDLFAWTNATSAGNKQNLRRLREEYRITAPQGPQSKLIHLNGKPLAVTPEKTVPPLLPVIVEETQQDPRGTVLEVAPHSILFARFLGNDAVKTPGARTKREIDEEARKNEKKEGKDKEKNKEREEKEKIEQKKREAANRVQVIERYGQAALWLGGLIAVVVLLVKIGQSSSRQNTQL